MLNQDLWDRCIARLEADLPEKEISTWIRPLRVVMSEDQMTLLAPNRIVMDRVKSDFLGRIQRTMSSLAAYDVVVNIAKIHAYRAPGAPNRGVGAGVALFFGRGAYTYRNFWLNYKSPAIFR